MPEDNLDTTFAGREVLSGKLESALADVMMQRAAGLYVACAADTELFRQQLEQGRDSLVAGGLAPDSSLLKDICPEVSTEFTNYEKMINLAAINLLRRQNRKAVSLAEDFLTENATAKSQFFMEGCFSQFRRNRFRQRQSCFSCF